MLNSLGFAKSSINAGESVAAMGMGIIIPKIIPSILSISEFLLKAVGISGITPVEFFTGIFWSVAGGLAAMWVTPQEDRLDKIITIFLAVLFGCAAAAANKDIQGFFGTSLKVQIVMFAAGGSSRYLSERFRNPSSMFKRTAK